ncbi:MAG TPA: hypothetical protein DHW02_16690 [Ktedonobacter sp.]|nr:hypothetical protein [Ktedonobacter sp.]
MSPDDIQRYLKMLADELLIRNVTGEIVLAGGAGRSQYHLSDPWFLYPGDLLKPWQLATTPTPFRMRKIFGGDHMLDRA